MHTYFRCTYGRYDVSKTSQYSINECLSCQLDPEHILLTTRHRAWVVLEESEYELLYEGRAQESPILFRVLEDLGIILTSRNIQDTAVMNCERYAFLHRPPSLCILVPTIRCNMACVYCHANAMVTGDPRLDMSEEVLDKAVDFFLSIPRQRGQTIHIEFQGGEPLLRFDLVQRAMDRVMKSAREAGFDASFGIVSNLTLLSDEIAADLTRRGNVQLCSSLDGPEAIHDLQRVLANGRGTHQLVLQSANMLRANHGVDVPFLPTLTTNSLGHEKAIIDQYRRLGKESIYLRFVNYTGRACDRYQSIGITPDEFVSFWEKAIEYVLEINRSGNRFVEMYTFHLLGNILSHTNSYMCCRRPCGCGISQLTISQDGNIHGCDGGRSVDMLTLGNVFTHGYDQIATSPEAIALRTITSETLPECQQCPFGPYCGYCVARGINQHGTPVPNLPRDFECQIFRKIIPSLFRRLLVREDAAILTSWG